MKKKKCDTCFAKDFPNIFLWFCFLSTHVFSLSLISPVKNNHHLSYITGFEKVHLTAVASNSNLSEGHILKKKIPQLISKKNFCGPQFPRKALKIS
jgi:hypothetical protein